MVTRLMIFPIILALNVAFGLRSSIFSESRRDSMLFGRKKPTLMILLICLLSGSGECLDGSRSPLGDSHLTPLSALTLPISL